MSDLPKTMRAVVYRGANDLRLDSVPVPRIGSDEVLVKVAACGVCPTDIKKIQYGTVPPPRIFGHETAGTIARVGARVRRLRPGDRVALHHHVPCLHCHACRHRAFAQCPQYKRTGVTAGFEPAGGGFAEYVRVMPFVFPGIVKIPERNSFLEGAMLEPVNTVLKAVRRLSLLRGDNVLVIGQGPIGLMFTRLLTLGGARVLASDLMPERLAVARELGAKWTFRADDSDSTEQIQATINTQGIDAVVSTVNSDKVIDQAIRLLNGGGKLLLFANTRRGILTPVDLASVCVDEKDILGSYSADVTIQEEVARLVFARRLDVRQLITHCFSLQKAIDAIALAAKPAPDALKVMICPGRVERKSQKMFKKKQKKVDTHLEFCESAPTHRNHNTIHT